MAENQAEVQSLSQELALVLKQTFSHEQHVRKAAEESLLKTETSNRLFGLAVLYLTLRSDLTAEIQVAAAIAFKNFIKRNWNYDPNDETRDHVDHIDSSQRDLIKQHITKLMIESHAHIQRQLSEAITIIGQYDFPDKWPNLIIELKDSLKLDQGQDFNTVLGILQTAHAIFRRYRYELQSNRLWSEIKLVIDHFAHPFTDRFTSLMLAAKNTDIDSSKLVPLYQSLLLCTEIYHSLITQDLPEFFEDHLNDWLPALLELLTVQVKLPNDSSVIEDMKSEICEIASLFVQRYSDTNNFQEYTQKFAQNIWNLLVTTNQDIQNDTLVSTAIRYLVTIADRPETRSLFQDSNVLNLLCQNVIIPNLTIRDIDEELFEDDPEEYVKRDIESSDINTRRRAACDLVQSLCKFQEVQLTEIFGKIIDELLRKYEENKSSNWKLKDLAIFLYSAMAIKGSTRQHGTVSVSQQVNVEKFFEEKIVDELAAKSQHLGANILKADALRYMTIFRNYITLNVLGSRLPLIVGHITSNNVVVRTYASITLEKLLTIRDPSQPQSTAFKPEQFKPFLGELIKTLFDSLEMQGSLENEHIMKAIMRLLSFAKSDIIQYLPIIVPKISNKLGLIARNPCRPYFNHYMFESIALTIRATCSQENQSIRDEFEGFLFNTLQIVLSQDVQEFTPYVLQLLNIILQAQASNSMSARFEQFFQELMAPTLWEKPANIPPLTSLILTFIEKLGQRIVARNELNPILGIFQKLLASKATDHEALALLRHLMIYIPAPDFDARIRDILMLIFQRLTGSKTTKFVKHVLVTFSLYAHLRGAEKLASTVNQLQDKIFGMVLEKLFLADVKKVTGNIDRRICSYGLIRILTELPMIDNGCHNHLWAPLLSTLIQLFELPQEIASVEEDHFLDIDESTDFQAQYSRLIYAGRKMLDPTGHVEDPKVMLTASLAKLSAVVPGFIPKKVQELDQNTATCLMKYCNSANVVIT